MTRRRGSESERAGANGRGPVVLLVEDDADLLELARGYLEAEGMVVASARDGGQALGLAGEVDPDVIVTDLMMPGVDGFAFLKRYAGAQGRHAPIVAVSAFRAYLDAARAQGVAAALAKPYDPVDLARVIRDLAQGHAPPPHPGGWATEGEALRLRAAMDLDIESPAPESALGRFVRAVAGHFGVPVAMVSLVTHDEQRWAAFCGLPDDLAHAGGTRREDSFCTHAVAARAALIVQDACENPFFRDNPLVRQRGVRFYAGVPLMARHGEAVGTLCVLAFEPRRFSAFDLELLSLFARRVLAALEQRERHEHPAIPLAAFRYLEFLDEELEVFGKDAFNALAATQASRAIERRERLACVVLAAPRRSLEHTVEALRARSGLGLIGRLGHSRLGWLVPGVAPDEARAQALEAGGPHAFAAAAGLEHFAGAAATAIVQLEQSLGDAGLV